MPYIPLDTDTDDNKKFPTITLHITEVLVSEGVGERLGIVTAPCTVLVV